MISLRIAGGLYWQMQADLRRPHAFAVERVGFLFVEVTDLDGGGKLLLSADYASVDDAHYVDDLTVGARINGAAIRGAMQRTLDTQRGCFHVHLHEHHGRPRFSRTDDRELATLIPSFQSVAKNAVHGAVVFSDDSAFAVALLPTSTALTDNVRISILAPPLRMI